MSKKYLLSFCLAVFLIITACEQTTTRYLGALADKKEAVALIQGAVTNQAWKDLYISVDYSYKRDGNHLGMKGVLSFTHSSQANYERVRDLKLKLFFLDKNLQVVEYFDVGRILNGDIERQLEFMETFNLPTDITAFTFGYDGILVDDEGFRSLTWKMPKRNH